jgi:hypothetical protein
MRQWLVLGVILVLLWVFFIRAPGSFFPETTFANAAWTDASTLTMSGTITHNIPASGVLSAQREATEIYRINDMNCNTAMEGSGTKNFWNLFFAQPVVKSGTTYPGIDNAMQWLMKGTGSRPDRKTDFCGMILNVENMGSDIWAQFTARGTYETRTEIRNCWCTWTVRHGAGLCVQQYGYVSDCCGEVCDPPRSQAAPPSTAAFRPDQALVDRYISEKVECYLDFGRKYYGTPEVFSNDQLICRLQNAAGAQLPTSATGVFKFGVSNPIRTNDRPLDPALGYCGDASCQSEYETSTNCPHDCIAPPVVTPTEPIITPAPEPVITPYPVTPEPPITEPKSIISYIIQLINDIISQIRSVLHV